jgi:plastocyanin
MRLLMRRSAISAALAGGLLPVVFPAPAAAATHVVLIDQMKYGPMPRLRVGDTVVFLNKDLFRHTVTASNNSFNLDLMPGTRGTLHINSAGHASFYCKYHPGMRGTMEAE